MMNSNGPDPDDLVYDEDSGMFVDTETGRTYYDSEGRDEYSNND